MSIVQDMPTDPHLVSQSGTKHTEAATPPFFGFGTNSNNREVLVCWSGPE